MEHSLHVMLLIKQATLTKRMANNIKRISNKQRACERLQKQITNLTTRKLSLEEKQQFYTKLLNMKHDDERIKAITERKQSGENETQTSNVQPGVAGHQGHIDTKEIPSTQSETINSIETRVENKN